MQQAWRAVTAVWMGVLLAGSLLPTTMGAPGGAGWHLAGYAILGALLARWRTVGTAWLLGAGYGALIEAIQWAVHYRAAEVGDLVVNGVGVALGILAGRAAVRRRRE